MKDALGHGSDADGTQSIAEQLRARLAHSRILKSGGFAVGSNDAAKSALKSTKPQAQPPVIPFAKPISFGVDRSSEIAYEKLSVGARSAARIREKLRT